MFRTLQKGMQVARNIPLLNLLAGLMMILSLSVLPGTSQAALLDFGPIVPEVIGSTPPNIGHGYPAWFRDTNRVPLQLCLDEVGGCLFLAADRPDLTQPLAFPNLPDELFYYSATATLGAQNEHLLFAGVEMNLVDNGDGTYDQVGFARVRIRIDSIFAGDYTITTPWKQYFFHVSQADIDATGDGRRVINATEDIGLRADGDFAGVLEGNIGPYVYSVGAPFGTAPNLYLGTGAPLPVTGSTFTDPVTGQPANIFRIQGPNGFATVSTNLFAVTGKLYLDPIPTPITVDRATYVRNATETRVNGFATTQALSNQVNPAFAFPLNFALTGAPSVLQISGTGIPTTLMTTNAPADGKYFSDSGLLANPVSLPATASVTNTADIPITVQPAPLVDEIVISDASYAPVTRTLRVAAASGDTLSPPTLRLFFPGETLPAGTLASGQVSVTFPITLGAKTYEIPPAVVTVVSSIGGSDAKAVSVPLPLPPPVAAADAFTVLASSTTNFTVLANDTGAIDPATVAVTVPTGGTATANPDGTVTYTAPAVDGIYTFTYTVSGANGVSNAATVTVTVNPLPPVPPATGVTLFSTVASPQLAGTAVAFNAAATGGSGSYEYQYWLKDTAGVYTLVQPFSASPTWNWNTTGLLQGAYSIAVQARSVGSTSPNGFDVENVTNFFIIASVGPITPATAVSLTANAISPQAAGFPVTFTGTASGGSGFYEYQFWLKDTLGVYTLVRPFSSTPTWTWDTTGALTGAYTIAVQARSAGTNPLPNGFDVENTIPFDIQ